MSGSYVLGEVVRLSVTITDAAGAAADPGALRLKTKAPSGAVTTYTYGVGAETVKDGVGRYRVELMASAQGRWYFRWESDAPNAGAGEGSFEVSPSRFIN